MNETLSVNNATYETEITAYKNQSYASEILVSEEEIKDPSWGDELLNYVLANQNKIVRCPWMGGSEVTLGEAMTTYSYPPNMTEKDVPAVMAVVSELLGSRVEEAEEKPEEAYAPKAVEVDIPNIQLSKTSIENQTPNQIDETNIEKQSPKTQNIDKQANTESENVSTPEKIQPEEVAITETMILSKPVQIETTQPIPDIVKSETGAKAESADNSSRVSAEIQSTVSPNTSVASAANSGAREVFSRDLNNNETISDQLDAENMIEVQQIQMEVAAEPEAAMNQLVLNTESHLLDVSNASGNEPLYVIDNQEPQKESPAEIENLQPQDQDIMDDLAGLPIDENVIALEDLETTLVNCEPEDLDELIVQKKKITDQKDEAIFQDDEPLAISKADDAFLLPDNEAGLQEQVVIEEDDFEQFVRIELNQVEIEDSLIKIAERIDASEPQAAEFANETLDKIDELTAKLENQDGEEIISEAELQEELEELFNELFNQLNIEHTPELDQSLARLTIRFHKREETLGLKIEDEVDETPQDYGTHEAIIKLLVGASDITKANETPWVIGKSALKLYAYDFPTELKKRLAA